MPEMNGYEVCEKLKKDPLTSAIPIIFVTANSNIEEEIYGLEMGAADYISKPFSPAIAKIRVRNQIELKNIRDKLTHLTITDDLTGIANRRFFNAQLAHEWQRAVRSNHPLAIAMIDVDWFKKYNDHYGHQAGDYCLRQVAAVLASVTKREGDVVARYGGEEFAFILPMTNCKTALMLAENICKGLSDLELPHTLSEFGKVTLSVGIAADVPTKNETAESLVRRADEALYNAKKQGRNRAVPFGLTC